MIADNAAGGIILNLPAGDEIEGNWIGTNSDSATGLGNFGDGVDLEGGANNGIGITIGGTAVVSNLISDNLISGNMGSGIRLTNGATNDLIVGNLIGTNSSGGTALANNGDGIDLAGANCQSNTIGGTASADRNVISGNAGSGISLSAGTNSNQILGNYIGTNLSGGSAVSNYIGISIDASSNNLIGGPGAGNVISGNTATISGTTPTGISITAGANSNQILGNYIGTNATGSKPLGNGDGIIIDSSSYNIVGGTAPGAGNVISGNNTIGIQISNTSATANLVEGNLIGTNKAGSTAFLTPNVNTGFPIGIIINDSSANIIGGTMPGEGNVIAGFDVGINISAYVRRAT